MPFTPPPAPAPVAWLQRPSAEDILRAAGTYAAGVPGPGQAKMACYVLPDGRLEACRAFETKSDREYERAILSLSDKYRVDVHGGQPPETVDVDVAFPHAYDVPPELISRPTAMDVKATQHGGLEGGIYLSCLLTDGGELRVCEVNKNERGNKEIVEAAHSLIPKYKFTPAKSDGKYVNSYVSIYVSVGPHIIKNPSWVRVPGGHDFSDAYPDLAWRSGLPGWVILGCEVAETGTLRNCQVREEKPVGVGFGNAALLISAKFKMTPQTRDGQPVENGQVTIPINFQPYASASPTTKAGSRVSGEGTYVLPMAPWIHAPNAAVVAAAFPKRALAAKVFGRASLLCDIRRDGRLSGCEVNSEAPTRQDFGSAAKGLASQFAIDPVKLKGADLGHLKVALNVNFTSRILEPPGDHYVRQPNWLHTAEATDIESTYPASAVKAGVFSGQAVIDCQIGAGGGLEGCRTFSETPLDLGFGEAAVKIAPTMQANLWTLDGEPAPGQKIRLPIKFIYSGSAAAASAAKDASKPPAPPAL